MVPLKASYTTQENLIKGWLRRGTGSGSAISGSKSTALQSCELTLSLHPFSFLWISGKQKGFIASRKSLEQSPLG